MKLPNSDRAFIPRPKLRQYLLSKSHPVGRWKAELLGSLGFDELRADALEQALLDIARSQDAAEVIASPYGTLYIIEGDLQTPSGRTVRMRTVWIIEAGQDAPRFVTAYPE